MIPGNAAVLEILLVEDSLADVRLTQEAFKDARIKSHVSVVGDGVEAMAYLNREGRYVDVRRPDLVLLDLNLPKKSGAEVLCEIKKDPNLRRIPVVILTTSQSERDVRMTYDLHANCFISKPIDVESYFGVAKSIENFWLSVVRLPQQ